MPKSLLPIISFVKIDVKRLFRDKMAIFWVFAFPLVFLFIFGSIFNSGSDVSFRVALINEANSSFSKDFANEIRKNKVFEVDTETKTVDQAKQKMNRSQLDATIILPKDFGATSDKGYPTGQAQILYDQSNQSAGTALQAIMNNEIFQGINQKLVPYQAPFSASAQTTATKGLSQFDYTFPGLLGFTLISLGIFGPTQVFPRLKSKGVLRRYKSTMLKVWQYFVGNVISNAIVGLLAAGIMFIVATTVFDLTMRGSYINLAVILVAGAVMLFGIGLAIGGWAKNENQAAPLAQVFALPMMFLSGVFFPTYLMPDLLQKVSQILPLTPVVESMRLIITENASLIDVAPQLGIIIGWTVIIYAVAFRIFRWE
jgi:ABC-2 type transport system permease protein